jgi:choice-of-anchor B domain-containing protein
MRVFRNHLYVVRADSPGGLQIFDLTGLRNVQATPQDFAETAFYPAFGSARNIAIDEEAGSAYVVGGSCDLHVLSLQDPVRPASVGCFREQPGRSTAVDAHCVVYRGSDLSYRGRKLCFAPRQEWVSIVDVQDGARPRPIAKLSYLDVGSASQGWLTDDHRYYLQADASDERAYDHATRTYLWDVADLDDPKLVGFHDASTRASDSALCVKGNELHQANSEAGYRMLSLSRVASGQLDEVAYFDMHPASDSNTQPGAFSSYPFFASGRVAVSDTALGLFVLQPTACRSPATPARRTPPDGGSRVASSPALDWEDVAGAASYDVEVATDPKFERVLRAKTGLASSSWTVTPGLDAATGYWWRVRAAAGCGTGAWTAGLSFTTASGSPGARTPRVRSVQDALRVLTKRDPSTLPRRKIDKRPLP